MTYYGSPGHVQSGGIEWPVETSHIGHAGKRGPFWESPPEKEVHLGSGPVGYTFGRSDPGLCTCHIGHAGKRRSVLIVPSATSDLRAWTCFSRAAPLSRSDLFFRPPRSDLFSGQPDLRDRTCFLDQPGPPAWRHIWGKAGSALKKKVQGATEPRAKCLQTSIK